MERPWSALPTPPWSAKQCQRNLSLNVQHHPHHQCLWMFIITSITRVLIKLTVQLFSPLQSSLLPAGLDVCQHASHRCLTHMLNNHRNIMTSFLRWPARHLALNAITAMIINIFTMSMEINFLIIHINMVHLAFQVIVASWHPRSWMVSCWQILVGRLYLSICHPGSVRPRLD